MHSPRKRAGLRASGVRIPHFPPLDGSLIGRILDSESSGIGSNPIHPAKSFGSVAERSKAPAWKAGNPTRIREFESLRYRHNWTSGRVVDGTGLENRKTGNRLVGSNPTASASLLSRKEIRL